MKAVTGLPLYAPHKSSPILCPHSATHHHSVPVPMTSWLAAGEEARLLCCWQLPGQR